MKEHEKIEKDQRLRKQLEEMWKGKVKVVPLVMGDVTASYKNGFFMEVSV